MKKLIILLLAFLIFACATQPKEPVTFSSPPATDEEQVVASAVETMITSYSDQNIDKHLACYSPDARIDSKLVGGFVTLEEYRKTLQKSGRLSTIQLKDAKINKVSADQYRVDAILSLSRGNFPISYNFVPIDGKWLIIEQRYR
jgi:hypothetical protein